MNRLINNNEIILWGITKPPSTDLIGTICFWRIEKENFRAEIGYVLHPDYHAQGIMKEALTAVIQFGFNEMHLHSITANVNPENAASLALLKSCGFVQEAYFRENYFFNGRFLDTVICSLLNTANG
jgi:ribosomal-protein-alanine N-acetyltransferase